MHKFHEQLSQDLAGLKKEIAARTELISKKSRRDANSKNKLKDSDSELSSDSSVLNRSIPDDDFIDSEDENITGQHASTIYAGSHKPKSKVRKAVGLPVTLGNPQIKLLEIEARSEMHCGGDEYTYGDISSPLHRIQESTFAENVTECTEFERRCLNSPKFTCTNIVNLIKRYTKHIDKERSSSDVKKRSKRWPILEELEKIVDAKPDMDTNAKLCKRWLSPRLWRLVFNGAKLDHRHWKIGVLFRGTVTHFFLCCKYWGKYVPVNLQRGKIQQ